MMMWPKAKIAGVVLGAAAVAGTGNCVVTAADAGHKAKAPCLHRQFPLPGMGGLFLLDPKGGHVYVEAGTSLMDIDMGNWEKKEIRNVLRAAPYGPGFVIAGRTLPQLTGGRHREALRVYQRRVPEGPMIVLRTPDFKVAGYRKGSGTPVWTYPAKPKGGGEAPVCVRHNGFPVVDGIVYGAASGTLIKIPPGSRTQTKTIQGPDGTTGTVKISSGSDPSGRPVLRQILFALDVKTGREIWTLDMEEFRMDQPPVVAGNLAFLAEPRGLSAVNIKERKIQWRFQHDTAARRSGGACVSYPAVIGNMVYFSTTHHENIVYAVDTATGKQVWRFGKPGSMGVMTPPVVGKKAVFVATNALGPTSCYALDKKTGSEIWKRRLKRMAWHAPVYVEGVLWLVTEKEIVGLAESDGNILYEYHPPLIGSAGKNAPKPQMLEKVSKRGETLEYLAGVPGWLFVTTTLGGPPPSTQFESSWSGTGSRVSREHRLLVIKIP